MNLDTILVVLLVWTGAGLLAAIAFGKVIRANTPEDDETVTPVAAGSVSYLRKSERKSQTTAAAGSKRRQVVTKRAAS